MFSIQNLPEELLQVTIALLVAEDDHVYEPYPESMYHYASSTVVSLSLVNHLFRRICFPFLFSYIKCKGGKMLQKLEDECLAHSAFTSFVVIIDFYIDYGSRDTVLSVQDGLVRLLEHCLPSLVWLELHDIPINLSAPGLLIAINAHHSLETIAITSRSFDISLPPPPSSLEKLLIANLWDTSKLVSVVQPRNVTVSHLHIDNRGVLLPLETLAIRGLRALSITEAAGDRNAQVVDKLRALVAHHPGLTNIILKSASSHWTDCQFSKPYISSFLDAVEARSLWEAMELTEIALSPSQSQWSWEVTGLVMTVRSSWSLETISLAGTMFPKISSLTIGLLDEVQVHIDNFVTLISQHFLNLRVLNLTWIHPALNFTQPLAPSGMEKPGVPFHDVSACMRWLAWRIFEASSSTIKISIHKSNSLFARQSPPGFLSASYRPRRNLLGTIVKMEIKGMSSTWQDLPLRQSVVRRR
ncbi:hypothetical protein C8J56DRAFT_1027690 [Mycena floridula]|nr:hypothetical protein C8J56DRAFT_1027690 [Mycena floridula]